MLKRKHILWLAVVAVSLLLISCSGKGETSSSVSSEENPPVSSQDSVSQPSSMGDDGTLASGEEPVYTAKVSISNDFPELELKLFADRDNAGLYHATRLEIYHASISTLPMQSIELNDCISDTPDFLLTVEDMNFDGVKDLRLVRSKGAQNTYYQCYLWKIESASFEQDSVLSGLPSPQVVESEKAVSFYEHISATDYREGQMRYLDENWVLTKETTQSYDSGTGLFTVTKKELEGGELAVSSKQTLTQQQLEESVNSSRE